MAPTIPHPDPLPATAPEWLFWSLLMITFIIHVVAMNFVLGGSVIAAVARFRRTPDHDRLAHRIGRAMPTLVATAVTFGVAPLLFLQVLYGRLFFTSSVLMGWWWFAVVPIVILAYYGTYVISFREEKLGRTGAPLAAVVALLFAAVAFIYVNNMTLMMAPQRFLAVFVENSRGTQLNVVDATFIPRFLHMLSGAIAVAGLIVAIAGLVTSRTDREHGEWTMRHGAFWFTGATIVSIISGFWWLAVLPRETMRRFMGADGLATAFFTIGTVAGIAALIVIARATTSVTPQRFIKSGGWLLGLALLSMIVTRDQLRRGVLASFGYQQTTWVEPAWGVITIFVALLIAAFAVTGWMLWILLRLQTEPLTTGQPRVPAEAKP